MQQCWQCNKDIPEGSLKCPYCEAALTKNVVDHMATIGPDGAAAAQIIPGVLVNNRYEIKSEIGRGEMGLVYLAHDKTMDRVVALKVISQEICHDPRAVADLKRETGIALGLTQENIVRLHNLDTWEGQAYVTMEYVDGGTLAHTLAAKKKLSLEEALPFLQQIAAALDYSHSTTPTIIHQDLKPLNILLTKEGKVKIADYGLARVLRDSATRVSGKSASGTMVYMAPEQVRGKGVGIQTDLYAFAAITYEMLSGTPPHHSGDLRWEIMHGEVEKVEGVADHVNAALLQGLDKERGNRPESAGEFLQLLTGEKDIGSVKKTPKKRVKEKKNTKQASQRASSGKSNLKYFLISLIVLVMVGGISAGGYFFNSGEKNVTRSSEAYGDIKIESNPSGAQIEIDGKSLGVTPLTITHLGAGSRKIQLKKDRYDIWEREIEIKPFKTAEVRAELKLGMGKLKITSTPLGATVKINGKKVGETPLVLERLQGELQVEVLSLTKQSWKKKVKVVGGESVAIVANFINSLSFKEPTTGIEFVLVKGGCYQMGDSFGDGQDDERPLHKVCVDDYYLGKYEVTQEQYKHIAGSNPSEFKKGSNYPVERVSWDDVQKYIKKLNLASKNKYRLPTEAEWEYAARSGGKEEQYSGGGNLDAVAWYRSNSNNSTHPVGSKSGNSLGLYDMTGNVWEWMNDYYESGYYSKSTVDNSQGPSKGSGHVNRGGSWSNLPAYVRAANRNRDSAWNLDSNLGFRLAVSLPGK